MTAVESFDVEVGGMTFKARASGPEDGRLVLLLHGFPQTSAVWSTALVTLAGAGYRAVAFDQRGYSPGARPGAVEDYCIGHLVDDVVAVADHLGGGRFDLVGHDWGGAVAWYVAGLHPCRVRTLTSVSTPHPAAFRQALAGPDQAARSWYIAWFQQPEVPEAALLAQGAAGLRALFAGVPEQVVDEYVSVLSQPGALTAALNWYRALVRSPVPDDGSVTSPTLYVWSTRDVALGREAAEATAGFVRGPYRFEVLEGVPHWVPEMAAEALDALLLDHLARHP